MEEPKASLEPPIFVKPPSKPKMTSKAGKELESYTVYTDSIPVFVTIYSSEEEFVPIYKVILNDYSSLEVTFDHKFLLWDGSIKTTEELIPTEDNLMPFKAYKDAVGQLEIYHNQGFIASESTLLGEYNKKEEKNTLK